MIKWIKVISFILFNIVVAFFNLISVSWFIGNYYNKVNPIIIVLLILVEIFCLACMTCGGYGIVKGILKKGKEGVK